MNNTTPTVPVILNTDTINTDTITDGHMTAEEVERHLQSKQSLIGIFEAPATVPTEMFSNEPSLDRWGITAQMKFFQTWTPNNPFRIVFDSFFSIAVNPIWQKHHRAFSVKMLAALNWEIKTKRQW